MAVNDKQRRYLKGVRVSGQEKADRKQMLDEIAKKTGADLIMVIGHIGGLYRPADKPVIQLPG